MQTYCACMRMFTPRFGPGHSRFILHTRSPEKQKDSFYFQACEVRLQCSSFRTTQPSSIHFQHPVSSRAKISRQTYVIFSYTVELVAADLSVTGFLYLYFVTSALRVLCHIQGCFFFLLHGGEGCRSLYSPCVFVSPEACYCLYFQVKVDSLEK